MPPPHVALRRRCAGGEPRARSLYAYGGTEVAAGDLGAYPPLAPRVCPPGGRLVCERTAGDGFAMESPTATRGEPSQATSFETPQPRPSRSTGLRDGVDDRARSGDGPRARRRASTSKAPSQLRSMMTVRSFCCSGPPFWGFCSSWSGLLGRSRGVRRRNLSCPLTSGGGGERGGVRGPRLSSVHYAEHVRARWTDEMAVKKPGGGLRNVSMCQSEACPHQVRFCRYVPVFSTGDLGYRFTV